MHVRRSLSVISAAALGASIALAAPAQAGADDKKADDFSIQQAVDDAKPGDTVWIPKGTYRETVTIDKHGITLKGHKVVIKPPRNAEPTPCDTLFGAEGAVASGICIIGDVRIEGEGEEAEVVVDKPVRNVSVKGVTVVGFQIHGLIGIGTKNLKVTHSKFAKNGGYGAASFNTHGTTFAYNYASDNGEPGFYVGDSPKAKAKVYGNYSTGNELGYFFRNASHGTVKHNVAVGNCSGIVVLADSPGPAKHWTVTENKVVKNNKLCDGPEEGTSISGGGIVLLGAQHFTVTRNKVTYHRSKAPDEAPSVAEGGIVVASLFPGGTAPKGTVAKNHAYKNKPYDIVWDKTGKVWFAHNKCGTSDPRKICR
jgi:nitrous oxidase accessory protein NosD